MLTIDVGPQADAIMLTRDLSVSINAAVPLGRQAGASSDRTRQQRADRCCQASESL